MGEITFSPLAIDAIGEAMNISLGSSATAVSNMLDHRVDITTPTVQVINAEDFSLGRIEPAIGVEIKYVCGLEGSNIMMLKRSDVKAIVDILLGTETPDEEFQLDELSVSVVCEVMNQMMGAASTALSDLLGRMVNISTPESFELLDLDKVREEHFPVRTGPIVVVSFQLSIEGVVESEFMNVMSVELARELITGMGLDADAESGGAPAAAPAPAPAPDPAPAPSASSGGTMSQEEIERMLAGGGDAAPAPAPAASSGGTMSQEEIERMLAGGADAAPAPAPAPAPQPASAPAPAAAQQPPAGYPPAGYPPYPQPGAPQQGGYPYPPYPPYYMYPPQQPAPQPAEPKVINTQKPKMEPLTPDNRLSQEQKENLDLIMGVSLEVAVEIGRTRRKIQDIIAFSKGSLVVLDKLAGEPVDLLVNGQCIARGDVVVIDDNFGIRITEILQKPDINELTKF
ncbi:MAG: flagellar motor switch phosphatase FliY [Oscillospiraceae bacterium]|mgnify:CR=1 FL=1|jgi:flagellar motor switch protein FliN/FliY|nr:flagellar motor switch phosphatase FliY [Oscillospiraceae bacterium]